MVLACTSRSYLKFNLDNGLWPQGLLKIFHSEISLSLPLMSSFWLIGYSMLHIFSSYILGERSSNSRIVDFHFIFYPRLVPSQNLGATEEDERGKIRPPSLFFVIFCHWARRPLLAKSFCISRPVIWESWASLSRKGIINKPTAILLSL